MISKESKEYAFSGVEFEFSADLPWTKTSVEGGGSRPFIKFTGEIVAKSYEYDKGRYTLNLSGGSADVPGGSKAESFGNFMSECIEEKVVGSSFSGTGGTLDLDKDGSYDISVDAAGKISVLPTNSIKGSVTVALPRDSKAYLENNEKNYFSEVKFVFSLDLGEQTIDLSSGNILSIYDNNDTIAYLMTLYAAGIVDHSINISGNPEAPTGMQCDLDRNGTYDIQFIEKTAEKGELSVLSTNSVKGSATVVLTDAAKAGISGDIGAIPFYSKLTIIITKPDTNPDSNTEKTENIDHKQKKTTISKITGGKKSITVKWKKQHTRR